MMIRLHFGGNKTDKSPFCLAKVNLNPVSGGRGKRAPLNMVVPVNPIIAPFYSKSKREIVVFNLFDIIVGRVYADLVG